MFAGIYKRSVYWTIVVLLVFVAASILTLFNNIEFYKYAETDTRLEIEKHAVAVEQFSMLCMEKHGDKGYCLKEKLRDLLEAIDRNNYYKMRFILMSAEGEVFLDLDNRRDRHRDREPIRLSDISPQQQQIESMGLILEIVSNVRPNLLVSTYNAITCNHIQGCDNGGTRVFYKFLMISLVVLFSVLLLLNRINRTHQGSKLRLIDERDHLVDSLRSIQDDVSSLQDSLSAAEELLDEESNSAGEHAKKVQLLSDQLEEKDLQVMQLEDDLSKQDAVVAQYAQREDESSRIKIIKKIRTILTRNPRLLTVKNDSININPGKHHSKDFVIDITEKLQSTDGLTEYGCSVTSDEYDHNHRNSFTVFHDNKLGRYCTKVVGDSDAGFAAKVTFSVEKRHEVLMLVKYIIATNRHFRKYRIRVR